MATKTINLTGAEIAVTGLDGAHAHITNMGADIIYAAKTAGITAGADGVVPIPAGTGNTLTGITGSVYLLGTGSVLIQTNDYYTHPSFRNSTSSGGSAVDDVARTAINTHAENAEIHVTTAEKTAWNGKAELTDIPTTLPANGGNADTVGNKHISQILATKGWFDGDMDDLKEPGSYIVNAAEHMPISSGWGTVLVFEGGTGSVVQIFVQYITSGADKCIAYIRHYTGSIWSAWANIVDGGNAASVGAYTEAKIAALEARIAALEGGSTT